MGVGVCGGVAGGGELTAGAVGRPPNEEDPEETVEVGGGTEEGGVEVVAGHHYSVQVNWLKHSCSRRAA